MATEQFAGTVHFIGLRASFKRAKELLADVVDVVAEPEELVEEIKVFLSQFETDA